MTSTSIPPAAASSTARRSGRSPSAVLAGSASWTRWRCPRARVGPRRPTRWIATRARVSGRPCPERARP
eukprot:11386749-Alexandrium_andersonii.AAC.2